MQTLSEINKEDLKINKEALESKIRTLMNQIGFDGQSEIERFETIMQIFANNPMLEPVEKDASI